MTNIELDKGIIGPVEYDIRPPMKIAVTVATSVPGVAIYVALSPFGDPVHAAELIDIARRLTLIEEP